MNFGGLSENDVAKIGEILTSENIAYEVSKDASIEDFNSTSIRNDLRHFSPPSLSTHMLSISINDEDFARLSSNARSKLLDFGITDTIPSPEDFVPFTGETVHKNLKTNLNRGLAMNLKHQILIGLFFVILVLLIKFVFTGDMNGN